MSRLLHIAVCWVLLVGLRSAAAQCIPCAQDGVVEVLPGQTGQPGNFAPRRAGAEVAADFRFGVSTSGLFRLTQPQLVAAGWTADQLVGSQLRLFCRTQEVAVLTSTDGVFTPSDYLEFYGVPHRGYYTTTNVYWLGSGGTGLRMAWRDAATNEGGVAVAQHEESVAFAPDLLYRDFYRPLEAGFDHWFAALLVKTSAYTIVLSTDRRVAAGTAGLSIKLFGLTRDDTVNPDHQTQVTINGFVTNYTFDGESDTLATGLLPASVINAGLSTVRLQQVKSGVTDDRAYLDYLYLCYPRSIGLRDRQLSFCGTSGTNIYSVAGWTNPAGAMVLDITDPAAPARLTNFSWSGSGTNFTLHFRAVSTQTPRYLLATPAVIRTAETPRRVFFRDLAATNRQADYLVVTPYAFREPAYRLLKHRASNGLAVAVAPLEDVYNEFGYGIEDAAPIQQFIGYAFHHWSDPPPRYALLMGEGTYDPRNLLGTKPPGSLLPVKLGPTPFSWSPRDNWYGMVNGDDALVDVVIGRMAGTTTNGISRMVNKTIAFERASRVNNAILVADNVDIAAGYNFAADSDAYIYNRLLPAGYSINRSYLDSLSAATIRANIRSTINGGRRLVSFFGHGNATVWCAEDVWSAADISSLTNARFPLVTIFSCQNGSFEDPASECLAEMMLEQTTNGAVAVMAPASESVQVYAQKLAQGFFYEFTNTSTRLGDSLLAAMTNLWNFNPNISELYSYGILGDPAVQK